MFESFTFKDGAVLRVMRDDSAENPREYYEHLGTIVHWHRRSNIGDICVAHKGDAMFETLEEIKKKLSDAPAQTLQFCIDRLSNRTFFDDHGKFNVDAFVESAEDIMSRFTVWHRVYLYEHSGQTVSTEPFACPWDSGQVGYIFVTKEQLRKAYSRRNITGAFKAKIEGYLKNEVEEFDNYLTGSVYGFTLTNAEGVEEDSCWGFFGDNVFVNGITGHLGHEHNKELKKAYPKEYEEYKEILRRAK